MGMDKYGCFMQYVFIISETIVNRVWKVDMFHSRDVSRGGHRVAPAPPQNMLIKYKICPPPPPPPQ